MKNENDPQEKAGRSATVLQSSGEALRRRAEERLQKLLSDQTPEIDDRNSEEEMLEKLHELRVHQIELEMQNEELRKTQEELETTRSRYFNLYDLAPVGYLSLSEKGLVLQANLTLVTFLSVTRSALVKQPFSQFILKEDQDVCYAHFRRLFETREPQTFEIRMLRKGASPFWVRVEANVTSDSEGAPFSLLVISDITAKKKIEDELRAEEKRYRSFIEVTELLAWTTNPEGEVEEDIPEWRKFSGQREEEIKGVGWKNALHPDDVNQTLEIWNRAVAQKKAYETEYRIRRYDGVYRHFLARGVPVLKDDGAIREWVGTCIDITERKQIEDTQMFLLRGGWAAEGEDFFKSMARYLGETLQMDFVCIDRLEGDGLTASTVAIFFDGRFQDNISYALKDTPCGDVVGRTICCFPSEVRRLFPKDEVLQEMMAESYVGTTLWGSKGQPIGLIAIIGRQPLTNPLQAESMLKLVALRAAGELERREAEKALRQRSLDIQRLNETLEQRVHERTAELAATNENLHHLSARLLSAQEDERKRIALEVHDVLGSSLSALKYKVEDIIQRIYDMQIGQIIGGLDDLLPIIKGTIEDVRRIQANLRPPLLDDLGILATISWYCRRTRSVYKSIKVEQTITVQEEEVPEFLKVIIFRIIQEAFHNIGKHAQTDYARVELRKINGSLELIIRDSGVGFDPADLFSSEAFPLGMGLSGMRHRAETSGGTFSIESGIGKGTVVKVVWTIE